MRYGGANDSPGNAEVRLVNLSEDYCDPSSACSFSQSWYYQTKLITGSNQLTYGRNGVNIATYNIKNFTGVRNYNKEVVSRVTYPSGRSIDVEYWDKTAAHFQYYQDICSTNSWELPIGHSRVKSVKVGGSTWSYNYDYINGPICDPNIVISGTVTNPLSKSKTIVRDFDDSGDKPSRLRYVINELNQTRSQVINEYGRLFELGFPEDKSTTITYDNRGNVTEIHEFPKSGFSSAPQVSYASYSATCPNMKTCNKPIYVIDAKGLRTDYTYDSAHGGILTETGPADANGVRPQKRYSYSLLYPKIKISDGSLVNSVPVWRLTKISVCKSASSDNPASCIGTSEETVTEYTYNTNNLFKTAETVRAGDYSSSATTTYTFDVYGNVMSVDGPRTDVDDRSYTTWDVLRRKVFEIGPDPDGGGALKRQIVKHYYDADGLEIRTEVGTGNNTDGSDFVWSSAMRMTYDGAAQLIKTEVVVP